MKKKICVDMYKKRSSKIMALKSNKSIFFFRSILIWSMVEIRNNGAFKMFKWEKALKVTTKKINICVSIVEEKEFCIVIIKLKEKNTYFCQFFLSLVFLSQPVNNWSIRIWKQKWFLIHINIFLVGISFVEYK